MTQTVADSSCFNCKVLERLPQRDRQFQFKCPLEHVRAGLIIGTGAVEFLTYERDGETIRSTHMLLSHPKDMSCEYFAEKPPE